MTWLALFFALEVGFLPGGYMETYTYYGATDETFAGAYYVDMDAEVRLFDILFIGGGSKVYMDRTHGMINFIPNTVNYNFVAGARYGPLEVGFRHYCIHPIMPWSRYRVEMPEWEGWYEEIYVRIEGRF